MESAASAPGPADATAPVWVGLLLVSFAINFTAIVVALHLWAVRPEPSEHARTPMGYVLALAAAALLAVATILEGVAIFHVQSSAMERFATSATLAQLPIAFAVFAYSIYRKRPPAH
jgi:hypothetical protein